MKVIFLDIDGVLNSQRWVDAKIASGVPHTFMVREVDQDAVKILNQIIAQSGAKIVVSSSWRIAFSLSHIVSVLNAGGLVGDVIDQTPHSQKGGRGREIQTWLDMHPEVTDFVCLDDNSDFEHLLPKLVRTTWENGLQEEHIGQALKLLGM